MATPSFTIRLRALPLSLRLALTCLILVLSGGLAASAFQIFHHYHNKDEDPAFTLDDIVGSFHGMDQDRKSVV